MRLIALTLMLVALGACAVVLLNTQRVDAYDTARVRVYRLHGTRCRVEVLLPQMVLLTGVTTCVQVPQ